MTASRYAMRTEHIRFLPERPRGVVSDAGSTGVASDGASQDPAGGIDTTHVPTESGPVATYDGSDEPLLGSEYLSILSSVQINRSINSFLWTTAAADARQRSRSRSGRMSSRSRARSPWRRLPAAAALWASRSSCRRSCHASARELTSDHAPSARAERASAR